MISTNLIPHYLQKELDTVSIANWPCPLAKVEISPSSKFLVGIICLILPVYRNDMF
jgi:hypothetical protein